MESSDGNEQVLYTDEVPKLVKKGDLYLPDKHVSPLNTLHLGLVEGDIIGGGQYYKVKKVFSEKRNRHYVMKVFCKMRAPEIVRKKFFPREVIILKKLCHEHVLGVNEVLLTNRKGYILMDYMPNGDLLTYINKQDQGHLSEPESRYLFHQLQSAVSYLHSMDIVHRDVKCDNLLFDKNFQLKLCDFGFATICKDGEKVEEACGSMGYVAPEILEGEPYEGKPVDIWSMGVTLFAMLCGRLPYHEDSLDILLDSIYNPQEKLCFPCTVSKDCRSFVHALLMADPAQRAKLRDFGKLEWLAHPVVTSATIMKSQRASGERGCTAASSGASLDAMLQSCSNRRKQSVSFDTDIEHGFSESQKKAGEKEKDASLVTDVLKAVAVRHAFGESPMSVHKNLDTSIGHGPHHFAHDTIGLKGPAARRISVQLSQTNLSLNQTHATHHRPHNSTARPMTAPPRAAAVSGRRQSLAPQKSSWKGEQDRTDFAPSRKNSILMLTANSKHASALRRGSLALHCGKLQPGGSTINLSSVDLVTYASRLQEKSREHEMHDLHHSLGAKIAQQAGTKHHRAAETTRRNSVFAEDMKLRQLPNALRPEEQEVVNSFRSQCEHMKHLVA